MTVNKKKNLLSLLIIIPVTVVFNYTLLWPGCKKHLRGEDLDSCSKQHLFYSIVSYSVWYIYL